MSEKSKVKAIALLSGGLDSILAVRLILEQGIKVTAIKFMTYFGCDAGESGSCGHDVSGLSKEMGFELKLCHLGQDYINMVRKPKHGWGKNMNPCIDCRGMMLSWAKEYMATAKHNFIITGEVLGQRPMSQQRGNFAMIDKEVGLAGYILRPLSAKLLKPTIPEVEGLVDREKLLDISGRSRKRQYELAAKYGIKDFGQPAGGCLLTDPAYSVRLRDLFKYVPNTSVSDIELLKVGRHFRPNEKCKIIVGRNEQENITIDVLAENGDALLSLKDYMGPTAIIKGDFCEEEVRIAAALTVRYGDVEGENAEVKIEHKVDDEKIVSIVTSGRVNDAYASEFMIRHKEANDVDAKYAVT